MEVEIKLTPLQAYPGISDAEKNAIVLVATAMSTLHLPSVESRGWSLTKIQGAYDIIVHYPLKTFFSLEHLLAIRQVNPIMIKNVWVRNDDSSTISLCCKLGSLESGESFRLTEVVLQFKYEDDKKRKRPDNLPVRFMKKQKR